MTAVAGGDKPVTYADAWRAAYRKVNPDKPMPEVVIKRGWARIYWTDGHPSTGPFRERELGKMATVLLERVKDGQ